MGSQLSGAEPWKLRRTTGLCLLAVPLPTHKTMSEKSKNDRYARAVLEANDERVFQLQILSGQDPEGVASAFADLGCMATWKPGQWQILTVAVPLGDVPAHGSPFAGPSWRDQFGPI